MTTTTATFTSEQVERGKKLLAVDLQTRLELGDLLLEVAPMPPNEDHTNTGAFEVIDKFAAAVGLGKEQARQYRRVSGAYSGTFRQAVAETGVSVSYSAVRAAVLSSGGAALLLELCQEPGRVRLTKAAVDDAIRKRWVSRLEEDDDYQRRHAEYEQMKAKRAAANRQETKLRRQGLQPYVEGVDQLVDVKVNAGMERAEAEIAVVREFSTKVVENGGSPDDLTWLRSPVIGRHSDVIAEAEERAKALGRVERDLHMAEFTLASLIKSWAVDPSPVVAAKWRTHLDRITTHVMEIAQLLPEGNHAAE